MPSLEREGRSASPGRPSWYRDPVLLLTVALVFSIDQVTKAVVRHTMFVGESIPRDGPVRITHTFNTGTAFGLFPDQTFFLIIASLVGISVLVLVYRNPPFTSPLLRLSLGVQLGGAAGNLLDRIRVGQVTDFVDLGFWPVFNVADAAIVVGIFGLAYLLTTAGRGARAPAVSSGGQVPDVDAPHAGPYGLDGHESEFFDTESSCPLCGFAMDPVRNGWRCTGCGAREWIDRNVER